MKKGLIILGALVMLSLTSTNEAAAQGKGHGHGNGHHKGYYKQDKRVYKPVKHSSRTVVYHKGYRRGGPPVWAPAHGYRMKQHVYFPDYYVFYDPYRNGYVYWNNSAWIFSPVVPPYMSGVDMNRARIQIISDIPLTTRPERNWNRYYHAYPPSGRVNININLPIR